MALLSSRGISTPSLQAQGEQRRSSYFKTHAGILPQHRWPFPLVEFFLGRRTADATLATASDSGEHCEAQFGISQRYLLHDDREAARTALKEAADICPKHSTEYVNVKAELMRLGPQ
jgi:hypothetical protein